MQVREAIQDIAQIRRRLQVLDRRRAFRSISIGISGIVIWLAAIWQTSICGEWESNPHAALSYWLVVALVCFLGVALEVGLRVRSEGSRLTSSWSRDVLSGLLPCGVLGFLLTWALAGQCSVFVLPGVWAALFGLGLYNVHRFLPQICQWVTAYFLVAGVAMIRFAEVNEVVPATQMVALFTVGQIGLALSLSGGLGKVLGRVRPLAKKNGAFQSEFVSEEGE